MCTVSMVMDHYSDKWRRALEELERAASPAPAYPAPATITPPRVEPPITDAEIREFRSLLERARKYDRDHGQPDCELREKRETLKRIAEAMGVDVSFVDQPEPAGAAAP